MGKIHRRDFISVIGSLNEIQGQTYSTTGRDRESNEKSGDNGQLCLSFSFFPAFRQKHTPAAVTHSLLGLSLPGLGVTQRDTAV